MAYQWWWWCDASSNPPLASSSLSLLRAPPDGCTEDLRQFHLEGAVSYREALKYPILYVPRCFRHTYE